MLDQTVGWGETAMSPTHVIVGQGLLEQNQQSIILVKHYLIQLKNDRILMIHCLPNHQEQGTDFCPYTALWICV